MGTPGIPNYHGRQLLRELKKLREVAGYTQEEAGSELHLTLQKLSRIENGQLPGYHELRAMLDVYGLPSGEWQPYLDLWDRARKRGWWRKYGLPDSSYVCMEHEASQLYEFQLGYLPGLLQTERYARTIYEQAVPTLGPKTIESNVSVRLRRQDRLFSDHPLTLRSLIHEPTLYQGVDRAQLTQLVARAEMPNVTVQIVPQTSGLHGGLLGSTILLSFDDQHEPDIVFAETFLGITQSQDDDKTAGARMMLDDISARALNPHESLVFLKRMIP
jgi:transcriptional regulator with XRE-family HTH domain